MRISSCKGLGARAVGVGRKCGRGRGEQVRAGARTLGDSRPGRSAVTDDCGVNADWMGVATTWGSADGGFPLMDMPLLEMEMSPSSSTPALLL